MTSTATTSIFLLALIVFVASANSSWSLSSPHLRHHKGADVKILTISREFPSSNTHIVYDNAQVIMIQISANLNTSQIIFCLPLLPPSQILVVDVGKEEADADQVIFALESLTITGRNINAIFITHGHPDHGMALWKVLQAYPSVPVRTSNNAFLYEFSPFYFLCFFKTYVATGDVRNELNNAFYFFGRFLNQVAWTAFNFVTAGLFKFLHSYSFILFSSNSFFRALQEIL